MALGARLTTQFTHPRRNRGPLWGISERVSIHLSYLHVRIFDNSSTGDWISNFVCESERHTATHSGGRRANLGHERGGTTNEKRAAGPGALLRPFLPDDVAAARWSDVVMSHLRSVERPAKETGQAGAPAQHSPALEIMRGGDAFVSSESAFCLLTADMCCRALHASGRRPYDRSGFKITLPTRSLRASALLSGCCRRRPSDIAEPFAAATAVWGAPAHQGLVH